MTTAVYALSGDPITFGHIDIIERASKGFEKLIVGIGNNSSKKYLLTDVERLEVAKESLKQFKNVEVQIFEGLLVDFAYEQRAEFIVRGIRNSADFEAEKSLDQINSTQMNMDTILLFSKSKLSHVSSSNVKAIQLENGLIHEYVPLPVKKILERKISKQLIVGVTGVMGSGKSYIAEQLEAYARDNADLPLKVFNIELDTLAKEIYTSDKPSYIHIREQIKEHFGTLDKKEIAKMAFDNTEKKKNPHLKFLNDIFKEPVMVLLRRQLKGKEGIILINSAILVESDLLNLCNNHVILVNADTETRHFRLQNFRNIDPIHAENRIKNMLSTEQKENLINKAINKSQFGEVIKYNNSINAEDKIADLYDKLVSLF